MKIKNILVLGILLIGAQLARAASFQYIFNNVEQGDNSSSNPSIVVDGEKVTKKGGSAQDPVVVADNSDKTVPALVKEKPGLESDSEASSRFRLLLGASFISNGANPTINTLRASGMNYSGTFSFFPLRDLGLSFLAISAPSAHKTYLGGELEFVPIRMEVLGMKNFLDLGLLGGYTTLGQEEIGSGTPHLGARLDVNFNSHLSISAAGRTNITKRDLYQYAMADLGLAWHF